MLPCGARTNKGGHFHKQTFHNIKKKMEEREKKEKKKKRSERVYLIARWAKRKAEKNKKHNDRYHSKL